jgi:hypothetical protein
MRVEANDEGKTPGQLLAATVREVYDAAAKATAKGHAVKRDCPDAPTLGSIKAALPHLQAAMTELTETLYCAMQYEAEEAKEIAAAQPAPAAEEPPNLIGVVIEVVGPEPGNDDPAYSLQDEEL